MRSKNRWSTQFGPIDRGGLRGIFAKIIYQIPSRSQIGLMCFVFIEGRLSGRFQSWKCLALGLTLVLATYDNAHASTEIRLLVPRRLAKKKNCQGIFDSPLVVIPSRLRSDAIRLVLGSKSDDGNEGSDGQ